MNAEARKPTPGKPPARPPQNPAATTAHGLPPATGAAKKIGVVATLLQIVVGVLAMRAAHQPVGAPIFARETTEFLLRHKDLAVNGYFMLVIAGLTAIITTGPRMTALRAALVGLGGTILVLVLALAAWP